MIRRLSTNSNETGRSRSAFRVAGWLAAVLSLLTAAGLLATVLLSMLAAARQAELREDSPLTVIILTDNGQSSDRYRILRTGLLSSGFSVRELPVPVDGTNAARRELQDAVSLSAAASHVWLIADGPGAVPSWQVAGLLTDVSGFIMISPKGLDQIDDFAISQWPADRYCLILSTLETSSASRVFFELTTGEDTALFPPYQPNPLKPMQFASADGLVWLLDYPALFGEWALLSFRLLPDLADWLDDWADGQSGSPGKQVPAGNLITLIFQLLLAGILILAIPAGLSLALSGSPVIGAYRDGLAVPERRNPALSLPGLVGSILLWVPAAVVATAMGMALALLAGHPDGWLLPGMLLLPGCRGYLVFFGRMVSRRHRGDDRELTDEGGFTAGTGGFRMLPSRITGLVMLGAGIGLAVLWIWLSFGSLLPTGVPAYWLPIVLLVGWPAGLAGTPGLIGKTFDAGLMLPSRWYQTFGQHLPFVALVILAWPLFGWLGLITALMLLVVNLWSVSIGKAATWLTGRPGVGSLLQAFAWLTALLLPPITLGL